MPRFFSHTGRTEKTARGRVVARETKHNKITHCDKAGDWIARERDLAFARPTFAETLGHPIGEQTFFCGEGAPDGDPLRRGPLRRLQIVEFYEQIGHKPAEMIARFSAQTQRKENSMKAGREPDFVLAGMGYVRHVLGEGGHYIWC